MKLLKELILRYGKVYPGNVLKVDGFLNHQVDTALMQEIGTEFARLFKGENITTVLNPMANIGD